MNQSHTETVGTRVRAAREAAQLTQAKLADMVEVSRTAVTQWEAGMTFPNFEKVVEIARILKVRPEYIAFGINNLVEFRTPTESVAVPTVQFGQEIESRTVIDTDYISKSKLSAKGISVASDTKPFYWRMESEAFSGRYPAGSYVLLDGNVDRFMGEGDYLIWNGFTVQLVNLSVNIADTRTINFQTSIGGQFQTIDAKKVQVLGRVKGVTI